MMEKNQEEIAETLKIDKGTTARALKKIRRTRICNKNKR